MVADQLDYVVGVDPHRDEHAVGVVEVRSGVVVFETAVRAFLNAHEHYGRGGVTLRVSTPPTTASARADADVCAAFSRRSKVCRSQLSATYR